MKAILTAIAVASTLMITAQANAQTRAPGDWWRTGEARTASPSRLTPRARGPRVAGFRARRSRGFDDQARYNFGGRGLPTWAVRAFEPRRNR